MFLIFSCVTLNNSTVKSGKNVEFKTFQETILNQAYNLLGRKYREVVYKDNKKYSLDCFGLVSIVYSSAGIDLSKHLGKYGGSGVGALFKFLKDIGAIHDKKMPEAGDIIFWDNTWDSNNDKNNENDFLTHAGMVVKVDDDATIHYVHASYVRGIVVDRMNLYRPLDVRDEKGKLLNSPMHINSYGPVQPKRWLSGDLWRQFGNVLENKVKVE